MMITIIDLIPIFVRQTAFECNGNSKFLQKYWTKSRERFFGSEESGSGELPYGVYQNALFQQGIQGFAIPRPVYCAERL